MVSAALDGCQPQTAQAGETVRDTAEGGKYENGTVNSDSDSNGRQQQPRFLLESIVRAAAGCSSQQLLSSSRDGSIDGSTISGGESSLVAGSGGPICDGDDGCRSNSMHFNSSASTTSSECLARDCTAPADEAQPPSIGLEPSFVIGKCRELMPTWSPLSPAVFEVNGPLSGLTNILYCVSHKDPTVEPKRVLFRMYGEAVSQLYDVDSANEVYKALAMHGFAPMVHSDFPEGRLEEWIYGSPLLDNPNRNEFRPEVGKILARFHMCDSTPGFPQDLLPRTPRLFVTGGRWANHVRDNYFPGCPMDRACKKVNLDAQEVVAEFDKLEARLAAVKSNDRIGREIVFCHNDSHENNILQLHADNTLRLIDFEYSGYNFAAYDIANYFAESSLDYSISEFPFFAVRDEWMATDDAKRKCVSAYLSERLGKEIRTNDTETLEPFLVTVEVMIMAAHLFWTVWGIIREPPRGCNPDEFGCIQFAEQRYAAYKRVLRRLIEQNVLPN